jgi:hypothetical protein
MSLNAPFEWVILLLLFLFGLRFLCLALLGLLFGAFLFFFDLLLSGLIYRLLVFFFLGQYFVICLIDKLSQINHRVNDSVDHKVLVVTDWVGKLQLLLLASFQIVEQLIGVKLFIKNKWLLLYFFFNNSFLRSSLKDFILLLNSVNNFLWNGLE